MAEQSVARSLRTPRSVAVEMGVEYGIRGFHALALARLPRKEAVELCERAVFLYPTDTERRGERIRQLAVAATS